MGTLLDGKAIAGGYMDGSKVLGGGSNAWELLESGTKFSGGVTALTDHKTNTVRLTGYLFPTANVSNGDILLKHGKSWVFNQSQHATLFLSNTDQMSFWAVQGGIATDSNGNLIVESSGNSMGGNRDFMLFSAGALPLGSVSPTPSGLRDNYDVMTLPIIFN